MSDKMKAQSWTEEQKKAISSRGKELLIAAGAGSGKTSVLTQRILEKIIEGSDISDFLVVTFTSASATDMKEKLKKKLTDAYAEDPSNKHLSNQISKMPFAQISTMDSFCLNLIKQYFADLNLSPTVRVADKNESDKIFEDAFEFLLNEAFEQSDENLLFVLNNTSCMGREDRLFKYLEGIYFKLRAHPRYIETISKAADILSSSVNEYKNGKPIEETSHGKTYLKAARLFAQDIEDEGKSLCEMGDNIGGLPQNLAHEYLEILQKGKNALNNNQFEDCLNQYNSASEFQSKKWSSRNTFSGVDEIEKKNYNEIRTTIKALIEKLKKFLDSIFNDNIDELEKCVHLAKCLKNLILRLDTIFKDMKHEAMIVDFTDCEQLTYQLLIDDDNKPTQIAKELASAFEEILVDEYQDTNPLQDAIFASLATKNNRFMVGDDKQSIYRFRNAYPDIFNKYKNEFNTETKECIFLRKNFRCSKEIIDFTNSLFYFLSGDTYKKEELQFAKKDAKQGIKTTVITLNTSTSSETTIYEAKVIANEIIKLKDNFVKENGEKLEFSDIAILLPKMKIVGEIYARELQECNIPLASGKPGQLMEVPVVKLVISILKAVENPHSDIPLASAMNSFFFGFTVDELVEIRKYKNSSLYGSVLRYAEETKKYGKLRLIKKHKVKKERKSRSVCVPKAKQALMIKCRNFIKRLSELRIKSRSMECHQFIHMLYENESLLSNILSGDDAELKKGNLLLLYSKALDFGKKEYKTLPAFLKHISSSKDDAYSLNETNGVSIMTIHASKGLEFPVCFLAKAGNPLTSKSFGIKKPIISVERGVFAPLDNGKLSYFEPLLFQAEEKLEKPEDLEENKRKLYVALTRAREKLYIVGSDSNLKRSPPHKPTSYLNWIHTAKPEAEYVFVDVENIPIVESSLTDFKPEEQKTVIQTAESYFVYPYESSTKIPGKLSVSQLKANNESESKPETRKKIKESDFLTVPRFAIETKKVSSAEIGTANHLFMQFSSFENVLKFGVEYEAQRLLLTNMITEEQYEMLNFENLKKFFNSNIFKRIQGSKRVYREKRFTVEENSSSLLGVGDDPILVQGVIDIFFENEDGTFTVADYKTDRVSLGEEHILAQKYKEQLFYYSKAVEKMTNGKVTEKIIYSFALGKEIHV